MHSFEQSDSTCCFKDLGIKSEIGILLVIAKAFSYLVLLYRKVVVNFKLLHNLPNRFLVCFDHKHYTLKIVPLLIYKLIQIQV